MAQNIEEFRNSIPVGDLGIIPLQSCSELGKMVNEYIVDWRKEREDVLHQDDKIKDSYIVNTKCSRFGSGEAKGTILDSIRGKDLYLLVDVTNYSIEYSLCGHMNKMSPDDHYSDLKRIITAAAGKARRINVIMPFLYESRQHKRTSRESLDCAVALQELHALGVENIITFETDRFSIYTLVAKDYTQAEVNKDPDVLNNSIVKTGDDTSSMLPMIFMAASLLVIIGILEMKRREVNKQK